MCDCSRQFWKDNCLMFRNTRTQKEIALLLYPFFYSWKYRSNTANKKNTVSKGCLCSGLNTKGPGLIQQRKFVFLLLLANYESCFSR